MQANIATAQALTPTFVNQDCTLTLREGLEEFYASQPELMTGEGLSPEAAELFANHDLCHVLFGCTTSFEHETMADTWTLFGTTVGTLNYFKYLGAPETRQIFIDAGNDMGYAQMTWAFLKCLPAGWRAARAARKMEQPWPWGGHEQYLDMRLCDVRQQFNIQVVA